MTYSLIIGLLCLSLGALAHSKDCTKGNNCDWWWDVFTKYPFCNWVIELELQDGPQKLKSRQYILYCQQLFPMHLKRNMVLLIINELLLINHWFCWYVDTYSFKIAFFIISNDN